MLIIIDHFVLGSNCSKTIPTIYSAFAYNMFPLLHKCTLTQFKLINKYI